MVTVPEEPNVALHIANNTRVTVGVVGHNHHRQSTSVVLQCTAIFANLNGPCADISRNHKVAPVLSFGQLRGMPLL
jgi:hypothetical protein